MAKSGSGAGAKPVPTVAYPTDDLPFGLSLSAESFIVPTSSGKFDVTLEVVCLTAPDKSVYFVAPIVDGNQQTGTVKLSRDTLFTFRDVAPQAGNALKLGFRNLRKSGNDIELELQLSLFSAKISAKKEVKSSLCVTTSKVGKNNKAHTVHINILDGDGNGKSGKVKITAGQQFEVDGVVMNGNYVAKVPAKFGTSLQIRPLSSDEGFLFTDLETRQFVKKVLLRIK